jgi:hypothetical protein
MTTTKVHRMTLATCNVSDVGDLGAEVVNPFDPVPKVGGAKK